MGTLLMIIAFFLLWVLAVPAFIFGCVVMFFKKGLNKYHHDIAFSIDQFGNVLCAPLFDKVLRQKGGYPFGDPDETISHVLGVNYEQGTLTRLGLFVSKVLNRIDKDHVQKAAKTPQ